MKIRVLTGKDTHKDLTRNVTDICRLILMGLAVAVAVSKMGPVRAAAIDWKSVNVGSAATVNFAQPSASSVTLNRALDSNPSQISGRINATGQVFLTNPNGIYFSPDGYIAMLAPESRNKGTVVASMSAVALAAGEAFNLKFEGSKTLIDIRETQSTIKTLVDNGNAVRAPGGLIILSALAVDQIQGGVVNNSGALEAVGLVSHAGVIRLAASGRQPDPIRPARSGTQLASREP